MVEAVTRSIQIRCFGSRYEWEVIVWGNDGVWLTRTQGLADTRVEAYGAALAYHADIPLRTKDS